MLYFTLKTLSKIISFLPYPFVIALGKGAGVLYYFIAKKQRVRAEVTIRERLGYTEEAAKKTIQDLCRNLGMTFLEILYMPALNKQNIRRYVHFDQQQILWEVLGKQHGAVLVACHMDNWEWLGATLTLNGFPLSSVEKPQPNRVYSDFMNELRRGVGQEIFSRGTSEILGCARALKKGRMLGLVADQDGGYDGIFVPFLGKMASTPQGPAYFARKFNAPIIPIFIVRNNDGVGHRVVVDEPIEYVNTGNKEQDDYNVTLAYTQRVEAIIKKYPSNWIWFQHRWNTPFGDEKEGTKEEIKVAQTSAFEDIKYFLAMIHIPKFVRYILAAILFAAAIITWLMFSGKSPMEVKLDNGVTAKFNATLKDSEISREKDGKPLWHFKIDEIVNDQVSNKTFLKGIKGKIYRTDGTYVNVRGDEGEMETDSQNFLLRKNVVAVHSEDGSKMTAEEFTWEQKTEIVRATGNVEFWKGDWYVRGDRAESTSAFKKIRLIGNCRMVRK